MDEPACPARLWCAVRGRLCISSLRGHYVQGDPTDGIRTVFLNLGRLARKIEQDLQYILVVSDTVKRKEGNGRD